MRTLPEHLRDGVDAAFRGADGGVHLFAGPHWVDVRRSDARPIAGAWGRVRNAFADNPGVDAAFVARGGELYVFADGGSRIESQPGEGTVLTLELPRSARVPRPRAEQPSGRQPIGAPRLPAPRDPARASDAPAPGTG